MVFRPIVTMTFDREFASASTNVRMGLSALLVVVLLWLSALPARAVTLVRDPDIEYSLQQLAAPILNAAGLGNSVRILVVNDSKLNAFVVDRKHIFIHSGLILRAHSPEMLQSVIAHEAAHIANGHIARRTQNFGNARTVAGLGALLAAVAGAASGNAEAGAGVAIGLTSSAQRVFLSHTRAEEASADKSAISYMVRAGVDTKGAVDVFDLFRGQEALNTNRQDPYVRSHPLTRDRLRAAKAAAKAHEGKAQDNKAATYWFGRAKGKLSAFMRNPKWTKRNLKNSPSKDVRLMREAVMYHRQSNTKKAISALNQAIALRPKDPYLYELKGQILMESRQINAAVAAYKKSVALAPNNALHLGGYGRALLAAKNPRAALGVLEKARSIDFRDRRILRDLGAAYAQTGNPGMASVATAERYALQGRMKDAGIQAKRALAVLPQGSTGWRRANDIAIAAKRAEKKRK